MINHSHLFQLYQSMTGSSVYRVKDLPAMPDQVWQPARIKEYAFMHVEVK